MVWIKEIPGIHRQAEDELSVIGAGAMNQEQGGFYVGVSWIKCFWGRNRGWTEF